MIRVLILEDLPADAERVEREVRKVFPKGEYLRVDTKDDFVSALKTFHPDIILADYKLSQFDCMSALELTRESFPNSPFFVVTRSTREDTASKCLKAGAWDCVSKKNIGKLGPAVQNAIEKKQVRLKQESESRKSSGWERMFDKVLFGLAHIDARKNTFIDVNATFARERGYSPEELQGRHVLMIYPPEQKKNLKQWLPPLIEYGHAVFESVHLRKDGSRFPVLVEITTIKDESGPAESYVAYALDISEQKRAEKAVRDEATRRRILMEQSRDGIVILDEDGKVYEANKSFCEMLGYSPEEIRRLWVWDWDPRWGKHDLGEMVCVVDEKGKNVETRHRRKDGSVFDVELCCNGVVIDDRKLIFCICRDITERKRAERSLREAQDLLNETQRMSKVGGWEYFPESGKTAWTDEVYRIHDLPKDFEFQTLEKALLCYPPGEREIISNAFSRAVKKGEPWDIETRVIDRQGKTKWIRHSGNTELKQGKVVRLFGNVMDITERKRAEEERERLLIAISQVGEGIVITDPEGRIQYVNPAFEAITGYGSREAVGQNSRILNSGKQDLAFYQDLWKTIRAGKIWKGRFINRRKDGTLYTEDATISPVRDATGRIVNFVGVKRDITDQLKLESQFYQAQKMESVGRLAGGVAHDYNNTLSVIIGYTEFAMERLPSDNPIYSDLEEILEAARRSEVITRQLLAFASQQTVAPKVLDLNATVESMLKILRKLVGEDIELAWLPGSSLWAIKMDPTQIDQILANLSVNARDAIGGVGKLTIETKNVALTEDQGSALMELSSGEYVLLSVSDNGCGMDTETLAKVFEPFFSTKEFGKGTGLGLATLYGIVKQNNGAIDVESSPGKGTTFRIYIPRFEGEPVDELLDEPMVRGKGETVLVVEDDASILKLTGNILRHLGYRVLTANTPGDARQLVDQHGEDIQLLITDVVMPEMNGKELAKILKSRFPDMKTLFMSGYSSDVIANRGVLEDGVNFINKPFLKRDFSKAVRTVLEKGSL